MTFPQVSTLASDFITIASDVVAAKTIETSQSTLSPEWILIGIGSLLVLGAKAALFLKATRALSDNAHK